MAIAAILRYSQEDIFLAPGVGLDNITTCFNSNFTYGINCITTTICDSATCKGYYGVYRVSFVLASFYVILTVLTMCMCAASNYVHRGYWWLKVLVIVGGGTGTLFAPNEVFAYYAWVARFIAPCFLLYQISIFIDLGYAINAKLCQKDEDRDRFFCCRNGGFKFKGLLLVGSVALLFLALGGGVAMFIIFPAGTVGGANCFFNPLAVATALGLSIFTTVLSLTKLASHGALFTSAMVSVYSLYFAFAAVSAWPSRCNPILYPDPNATLGFNATKFLAGFNASGELIEALDWTSTFNATALLDGLMAPLNATAAGALGPWGKPPPAQVLHLRTRSVGWATTCQGHSWRPRGRRTHGRSSSPTAWPSSRWAGTRTSSAARRWSSLQRGRPTSHSRPTGVARATSSTQRRAAAAAAPSAPRPAPRRARSSSGRAPSGGTTSALTGQDFNCTLSDQTGVGPILPTP